jgi:hypothetical protein
MATGHENRVLVVLKSIRTMADTVTAPETCLWSIQERTQLEQISGPRWHQNQLFGVS